MGFDGLIKYEECFFESGIGKKTQGTLAALSQSSLLRVGGSTLGKHLARNGTMRSSHH